MNPQTITMSKLNEMAMAVQAQVIEMTEAAGIDASILRSEYWLIQLITTTAHELSEQGVEVLYE